MRINNVDIKSGNISNSVFLSKNQALEKSNENNQLNEKMKIIKHKKKMKNIDIIKEKKNPKIILNQKTKKKKKKVAV